jgi:hypothetical protein
LPASININFINVINVISIYLVTLYSFDIDVDINNAQGI